MQRQPDDPRHGAGVAGGGLARRVGARARGVPARRGAPGASARAGARRRTAGRAGRAQRGRGRGGRRVSSGCKRDWLWIRSPLY